MAIEEPKEFRELGEGMVEFTQETCCALYQAFNKNPEVTQQLAGIVGEDKVKLFIDILFNSLAPLKFPEMRFTPSQEMKTVYGQIAKRELERIDAEDVDDGDITCRHTIDDHILALEVVVRNMGRAVH